MRTKQTLLARASALRLSTLVLAVALAGGSSAPLSRGEQPDQSRQLPALASDPWQASQLMTPEDLSTSLSKATVDKPLVLYVGFPVLYQGGHIAGAIFAGPASKPDGLQKLNQEVKGLQRDKQIVLYCGCCPWKDCPNIRPAFQTLKDLGFKNVKVLYLPKNLLNDWIAKGFPTQKADDAR
jgi:thiosulfate/3-mercaptopyruvate sulfurtransferase